MFNIKKLLAGSVILSAGLLPAQADEYTSYTEPNRDIKISSAETGVVQEVFVQEGQNVKAGDILVKLDTRVLERETDMAREELSLKNRRLEKLRALLGQKHASAEEVERAESDSTITGLRMRRAEAEVERLTLRTPIDGIVTELRLDVAESVPGPNAHVATVVQLYPMRVQFNLQAADARALAPGQEVPLFVPELNETVAAKVEFVSPVTTAVVNTVRVKMIIPGEPSKLTAGAKCVYKPQPQIQNATASTKPSETHP